MIPFLFPDPPRRLPADRLWRVLVRTAHLLTMALVLGGLAYGIGWERLRPMVWAAGITGWLLFAFDLYKSGETLFQGSGVAVLLKLGCLGLGGLFAGRRFAWYLAAAAIASVGAHMSGRLRHFSFRLGRVLESPRRRGGEGA